MAQLAALVVSPDEDFRRELGRLLRAGGVPVGLLEGHRAAAEQVHPDFVLVDIRGDAASGMGTIERLRAARAAGAIFAVALPPIRI